MSEARRAAYSRGRVVRASTERARGHHRSLIGREEDMPAVFRLRHFACPLVFCVATPLAAQDSTHAAHRTTRADSAARLKPVTIVAAPAERSQPIARDDDRRGDDSADARRDALRAAPPGGRARGPSAGSGAGVRLRRLAARLQLRPRDRRRALGGRRADQRAGERPRRGVQRFLGALPRRHSRHRRHSRADQRVVRQFRARRHGERAHARAHERQ